MTVKSTQKTISEKFHKFCQHNTLHGVFYLQAGGRWWVPGVWLVILSSSLGLCCYLSLMIWDKFVLDPTLTVVESTQYSTADVPFPSVMVCDGEEVYGPNTENISQLLSLRGYNRTQIVEFFQSFSELKLMDYEPKSYVKRMHYLLDDLGYPLSKLLLLLRKPCEQLLVECNWRSRPYNCSDMFRPVLTMMGHCCQFDIPYFKSQVGEDTNFVSGIQATEALDIVVDGQKVTPDGQPSDGRAFLYVIDPEDQITFINNAVALIPSAFFDVCVNLWTIDTSSYVKALALNNRRCIVDSDPGATSYQGCMVRHILYMVVEKCKCLPFGFTESVGRQQVDNTLSAANNIRKLKYRTNPPRRAPGCVAEFARDLDVENYSICPWDRLICVYKSIERVQADIRVELSQKECLQKCDYVQYETEVKFVKKKRSLQGVSSRSSVVVHFSDTTCMKYRREVLYTWDQMLANLGGIFGLCLGGSIISVIEIIWFMADILFTLIGGFFQSNVHKKKTTGWKKSNNQVFTTTHNDWSTKNDKNTRIRYKFTN